MAADDVLEAFSSRYDVGEDALRVLLAGQAVNVATGGVAFILIMTGFTGVDLVDNAVGLGFLVGLAVALTAAFGIDGTAVAAAVSISLLNIVRLVQVRAGSGSSRTTVPTSGSPCPRARPGSPRSPSMPPSTGGRGGCRSR